MKNSNVAYTQALKQLCIEMIHILDELRNNGLITTEEYVKHTSLKLKFVKDTEYI